MTDKLKELSEAVPGLGIDESLDPGVWTILVGGTYFHIVTDAGKTLAIAAIRDRIVARYGQVIVYDTLVLTRKFSWKVYDIVAEQYVYESGAHEDELKVAIECALAVKEKME